MEELNDQMIDLKDMMFNLGEIGGGKQLIFADLPINAQLHYVFTIGNKSKLNEPQQPIPNEMKKHLGHQLFDNILKFASGNKNTQPKTEDDFENIRIRCFRLTLQEQGGCKVEEIVDSVKVTQVAHAMGYGQDNQISM